jgi:hypothetical protein
VRGVGAQVGSLVHSERSHVDQPSGSSISGVPRSITCRTTVHHGTPSVAGTRETAPSATPTCSNAHAHARARSVGPARGAIASCCSVHVRRSHADDVGAGGRAAAHPGELLLLRSLITRMGEGPGCCGRADHGPAPSCSAGTGEVLAPARLPGRPCAGVPGRRCGCGVATRCSRHSARRRDARQGTRGRGPSRG